MGIAKQVGGFLLGQNQLEARSMRFAAAGAVAMDLMSLSYPESKLARHPPSMPNRTFARGDHGGYGGVLRPVTAGGSQAADGWRESFAGSIPAASTSCCRFDNMLWLPSARARARWAGGVGPYAQPSCVRLIPSFQIFVR